MLVLIEVVCIGFGSDCSLVGMDWAYEPAVLVMWKCTNLKCLVNLKSEDFECMLEWHDVKENMPRQADVGFEKWAFVMVVELVFVAVDQLLFEIKNQTCSIDSKTFLVCYVLLALDHQK